MAMDKRWKRKVVSRMSPVTTDVRRPCLLRKVSASLHIGPKDSIAIGTKIWLMASSLYFAKLHADDCSATNSTATDEIAIIIIIVIIIISVNFIVINNNNNNIIIIIVLLLMKISA